jgi:hypothetical protein
MDDDWFVLRIKDDDLQQPAGAIGTDDQNSVVALADPAERRLDGVPNVHVGDVMPAGTVGDLHW